MTWGEFITEVGHLLTVDEKRKALDNYKGKLYRAAVIKLQEYIPYYRYRHRSTFQLPLPVMASPSTRIIENAGETTQIALPSFMGIVQEIFIHYPATDGCDKIVRPVKRYPWEKRYSLFTGCIGEMPPVAMIDPNRELYLYPALEEGQTLEILWDGVRKEFADTDVVPWGEEAVECVSAYVKSRIAREVDKDLQLSASYAQTFNKERQELYLRNKTRGELIRG